MKMARWLIVAGSVILFGTALFHASGYNGVANAIEASNARPFLASAVKGLWLMFSAHLIILSLIIVAASRSAHARPLVLLCALMPVFDTLLLLRFAGVFAGTILIAIASTLFIVGGCLLPRQPEALTEP